MDAIGMGSVKSGFVPSVIRGLLLCLCLTAPGMAELSSEPLERLLGFTLEELSNAEISIASKTRQKIKNAPSSVTIFTRAEIRAMGVESVEQLMNFVPGFQATRETVLGDGYVVAGRGQSTPQASFNILFLIDGQRLNSSLSGGALDFNRFISLFNVKQVEIIRGTGSALYGDSAYTGVVNIVTDSDRREVGVYKGSQTGDDYHFNIQASLGDSSISFAGRHYSDLGDNYGNELSRYIHPVPITINDPRSADDFYGQYNWKDKIKVYIRRAERLETFLSINSINTPLVTSRQIQDSLFFKYTAIKNDRWQLNFAAGFLEGKRRAYTTITDNAGTRRDNSYSTEQSLYTDMDVQFFAGDKHELLMGFERREGSRIKADNFSNLQPTDGRLTILGEEIPLSEHTLSAIFVQDQFQMTDHLKMTAGVRYDNYEQIGDEVSPRFAAIYETSGAGVFKLIYGEGFRAPSIRQLNSTFVGNPNLMAEASQTTEAVWLRQFSNAHLNITYFQNDYMKKIIAVPRQDPLDSRPRVFRNVGSEKASGLEVEAMVHKGRFSLRSAYAVLRTEESPRFTAEQNYSFILNYHFNQWNINLNGIYRSAMQQAARVNATEIEIKNLEGYDLWNTTVRYAHQSSGWDFVFKIENLFDQEYFSPTWLVNIVDGLPNRGRMIWGGAEVEF